METTGLSRNQMFSILAKSPHGQLNEYMPAATAAVIQDPKFLAHLISWNREHGKIRDSKVALPFIASQFHDAHGFQENAMAHIAMLPPRDLLRGLKFAKASGLQGRRHRLPNLVKMYLKSLEANSARWDRTAVQHRRTLKELYALYHVKPSQYASDVLFYGHRPPGSVFEAISLLGLMSGVDAAATVVKFRIPFLVAMPALGKKLEDPDVMAAVLDRMSPSEVSNNVKLLEKMGVRKNGATRSAFDEALKRVAGSKLSNSYKLTQAASAVDDDELRVRVLATQEKKLDKSGIQGNWLILADKSSSMQRAIEVSKYLAALLSRLARGNVYMVYFDTEPTFMNVTGKTFEEITAQVSTVQARGSTSIGVGLSYLAERQLPVDGVAIVSDGGENTNPSFTAGYTRYTDFIGKRVPVYLYHVQGDANVLVRNAAAREIDIKVFEVDPGADYYSLENMATTMRTQIYGLVDEILETPLVKLSSVLDVKVLEAVGA